MAQGFVRLCNEQHEHYKNCLKVLHTRTDVLGGVGAGHVGNGTNIAERLGLDALWGDKRNAGS